MHTPTRRTLLKSGAAAAFLPWLDRARAAEALKVGFVYVGPVGDHGWSFAHDQGRRKAQDHYGGRIITSYVENVSEGPDAERVLRGVARDGAGLIFSTSFGFMNPTVKVAKRFPNVKFEHATGYKQAPNLAIYNARFYQGRSVCGAIAGHMSKAGVAGYIASFPIPEVIMGINAFTLAARAVNPNFQTRVIWVSSWYDPVREAEAAKVLIDQGADIMAQHTDSPAALQICEQNNLLAFGQSWDMRAFAPNAQLTAIADQWGGYYIDRIGAVLDGTWSTGSVWWGLKEGMVEMAPYGPRITATARAAAESMRLGIIAGRRHSFPGPIWDRDGALRLAAGETLSDTELHKMDWYVEGVQS